MIRYRLTLAGGESIDVVADDAVVQDGALLFQRRGPLEGPEGIRAWHTALALAPGTWVGAARKEEGDNGGA